MEELREKANNYAEENVINVLKEAFAKFYADGYRDGFKDREAEIPVDLRDNNTEYVDLGLPSGTLWATDFERVNDKILYQTYGDAIQFNIPTKEQWEELKDNCRWQSICDGTVLSHKIIIGPNGNKLKFKTTGLIKTNGYTDLRHIYFWVREEMDGNDKLAVHYRGEGRLEEMFCGFKLPIRLVK